MRPSIARRAADAPHSRAVGPETVPIGTASHDTFAAIRKAGAARIIPAGSLVRVPSTRVGWRTIADKAMFHFPNATRLAGGGAAVSC